MKIDQQLLDNLTEQAKASSRLRMNYDLRNSENDQSQRMLNAIEPKGQWHTLHSLEAGTVIMEVKDGPYEPVKPEDILS